MKSSSSSGTPLKSAGADGAVGLALAVALRSGVDLAVDGLLTVRETWGALLEEAAAFAALDFAGIVDLAVVVDLVVAAAARATGGAADVPGRRDTGGLVDVPRVAVFAGKVDAAVAGRAREGWVVDVGRRVPEGGTADTGLVRAPGFAAADTLTGTSAAGSLAKRKGSSSSTRDSQRMHPYHAIETHLSLEV